MGDVQVDAEASLAALEVNREKSGQHVLGQLSHLLAFRPWGEARLVRLQSGWTWLRSWPETHSDF